MTDSFLGSFLCYNQPEHGNSSSVCSVCMCMWRKVLEGQPRTGGRSVSRLATSGDLAYIVVFRRRPLVSSGRLRADDNQ